MPQGEMEALEKKDPLDIKAFQYDIVCNGVELSSGAIRNHKPEIMYKAFDIAGYSKEDLEKKFQECLMHLSLVHLLMEVVHQALIELLCYLLMNQILEK